MKRLQLEPVDVVTHFFKRVFMPNGLAGKKTTRKPDPDPEPRRHIVVLESEDQDLLVFSQPFVEQSAHDSSGDGGYPKEPKLLKSPTTHKDSGTRAASGIHRQIGDRDTNQMNQGQAEADGNRCEALRSTLVCSAMNDHQEHHGEDKLSNQGGDQGVSARRVFREAIGGEAACQRKA